MLKKLFTQHPASIDETYTQHMKFALYLSLQGLLMFCSSMVHALFPFLFERTTTNLIAHAQYKIRERQEKGLQNYDEVSQGFDNKSI